MNDISKYCLVSGVGGFVTITPAGRVILTEGPPSLRADDIDRIADDVGPDVALRTIAANGGTAALAEGGEQVRLTLSGRVAALIELPTAQWFVTPTGIDEHSVVVPDDALRFSVGLGALTPGDLEPNTVANVSAPEGQVAGQFVIDRHVVAEPEPTPVGLDVVDLSVPADLSPDPLPVASRGDTDHRSVSEQQAEEPPGWVIGIRCPLDHHNHPEADYCSQCGRKMGINATVTLVRGPRPPLGLFLLDDGGAIPIAGDLVIGRDATTHPDVVAGRSQAVALSDASNAVSRHHLAVTLQEWTVMVTDLDSANGTTLIPARTRVPQPLAAHHPTAIEAGDQLRLGPRVLQLELHHIAT